MGRQQVVSREYKVMLRPERFAGDEGTLLGAADAVWRDFSRSIADIVVDTDGTLQHIKTRRLITFLDTAEQHLNRDAYVFRDRRDATTGEREVTLKFRHPDRYVAQGRTMDASEPGDARTKFEEDIKAPFVSLYSFSTTVRLGGVRAFDRLKDVARLFPDLAGTGSGFPEDEALAAVGGFTARELVLTGASLQLGKSPKVDAECALVIWYDHDRQQDSPVAVELSYRYGDKDEDYGGGTTRRAFDAFGALQTKLRKWVSRNARTKTAFVYG